MKITQSYIDLEAIRSNIQSLQKFVNRNKVKVDEAHIRHQYFGLMPVIKACLLYTSPSPRDQRGSRMPSSA